MYMSSDYENYYDINGEQIRDEEEDIETGEVSDEHVMQNHPCLFSIIFVLYCVTALIKKLCDCLQNYKNRDI